MSGPTAAAAKAAAAPAGPLAPAAALASRPPALFALFAPVTALAGVGPTLERQLRRLLGRDTPRCLDLLALAPVGAIDPRPRPNLAGAAEGETVTLELRIGEHRPPGGAGRPWRITGWADATAIELVFFSVRGDWLVRRFPVDRRIVVHGRLGRWGERWQLAHPEVLASDPGAAGCALALYPLVEGLTHARMRKLVAAALERAPVLPEWLEPEFVVGERLPAWRDALRELHEPPFDAPAPGTPTARDSPARRRLAYDELLASQLALRLVRAGRERAGGRSIQGSGALRKALLARLPFSPTRSQNEAVAEILADMARPAPMLRLLQGDVGSGKTLVALLAMLNAVEAGHQAALMAPTEALAHQHARTLGTLAGAIGLEVVLLTGREPARRRQETLARIAAGTVHLVVGTHALFQTGVVFADLALAVIDEQHRFGVHQRLALRDKGVAADTLLTTATPIPRTLLLSAYGDLATSRLLEKPAGRSPIRTSVLPLGRLDEVLQAVAGALERGERLYWICPLIQGSAAEDDAAAEARFEGLRDRFGSGVGLVHGRLKTAEKGAALADFAAGRTRLLVATTVVEVGIDVPEASIMVIERAERFGLTQLHQLRGRVGRGERASSCVLLYQPPLGAHARGRLEVIRATEDGFRIAEEDLRLRGPGEVLGVRQSGLPETRFADIYLDQDLLAAAHDDARAVLASDPDLLGERGRALRLLLHLFDRPETVRLQEAG
ncbi:MAG TPA: ATP-dependent DNA helicase RecG [Geminicoccaceae bacterium]|nr:ATP-dependent DNA helicase RecG [Geminicoccaceae bacterium]